MNVFFSFCSNSHFDPDLFPELLQSQIKHDISNLDIHKHIFYIHQKVFLPMDVVKALQAYIDKIVTEHKGIKCLLLDEHTV